MRNKKILMVTPSLTGGGSERVMAILAGELAQVHDVTLCLVREKKDSYKVNESVKVVRFRSAVKSAPLKMLSRELFLRKEMKKCDCVISFMYDINFLTLVSGIGLKKSIIVCMILCISGNMKAFDHIYTMTAGGPGTSSMVMAMYAYVTAITKSRIGYGMAMSIGILILSLARIILSRTLLQRIGGSEDE